MKRFLHCVAVMVALGLAACGGTEEPTDSKETITKAQARSMDGKSDGVDLCDFLGWYGDGICDDFCPDPDPDCAAACTTDADCAVDQVCVSGVCEAGPTDPDDDHCGGFAGFTCQPDEWCDYPDDSFCGAADQLGTCQPQPDDCAQVYDPVCGCDGQTYSNACTAHAAGVDAAAEGPCQDPDACTADSDCAADQVCVNGACEDANTCTADSDCAADQVCVDGACEPGPSGGDCGGFAGFTCQADEWCDYPDDSYCGAADQLGTCQPQPDDCAQVYDPVCGCDGETYSNACTAHAAGVDAAAEGPCQGPDACTADSDCAVGEVCVNGACEDAHACAADSDCAAGQVCVNGACEPGPSGGDCGGFAGFTCEANEWCDYPDDSICGAADQLGTCQPRPDACAQVYDPVCGCDGQTYSNGCMANAAGVDIVGSGSCN